MKELLLEYLSDLDPAWISFERADYKGSDGYEVNVRLKDNSLHQFWFAKINRMGAEHMATVIRSYLKETV